MKLLHGSALSSGQTPGQLSEQNESQRMSKVVRIIFEYKEDVICKNSDGGTHRGVSLDIRSTGIKKKDNGPAMIFGVVMLAESRDFAELVAMKARALMKDMNMSSGVIKGNEFNQQG